MGRQPCCDKVGVKKGPWTAEEDKKLINFILNNRQCCWRVVPKLAGLLRCGKSCRLRWTNYLRPDLKRGLLSESEEKQVIDLHSQLGNRWSKIAAHLPGRTDNEIKNYWNTHIKKKLRNMGIDPVNHNPLTTDKQHQPSHNHQVAAVTISIAGPAASPGEHKLNSHSIGAPIVEHHELTVPYTPPSINAMEIHLPLMEWQESVSFWGLHGLMGWDFMADEWEGKLSSAESSSNPFQGSSSVSSFDHDQWKFELF